MNNISPIQIATPILDDYFPIISALPQIPPLPNTTLQIHCLILYWKNTFSQKVNFQGTCVWRNVSPLPQDTFCIKGVFLNILCKVFFVLCLQWWTPRFTLSINRFILKIWWFPLYIFPYFARNTHTHWFFFFGDRWEILSILKKSKITKSIDPSLLHAFPALLQTRCDKLERKFEVSLKEMLFLY